jgi:plasmid stabilization system protein ParE
MNPAYRVSPAANRDIDDQAEFLARAAGVETSLRFMAVRWHLRAALRDEPALPVDLEESIGAVVGAIDALGI